MRIEHIAIWARDIERLRCFYEEYFHAVPSGKYTNPKKSFSSCFLSFESGPRLEIMQMDSVKQSSARPSEDYFGFAHFSFSVGTRERVNYLTERLKDDGYQVIDGPRNTGDGYYESTVLDPESNKLEITI